MVSGSPVMMAEVEALIRRNSAMNIELFGRVNSDDIDLHLRHAAHTVLEHVLRSGPTLVITNYGTRFRGRYGLR